MNVGSGRSAAGVRQDPQVFAVHDDVGVPVNVGIPLDDQLVADDVVPLCDTNQGISGLHLVLNPAGTIGFGLEVALAAGDLFQFIQVQFVQVVFHFCILLKFVLLSYFFPPVFLPAPVYTDDFGGMAVKTENIFWNFFEIFPTSV